MRIENVRRMLQVMTRNKYGSTFRLVILHEQLLQMVLTAGCGKLNS